MNSADRSLSTNFAPADNSTVCRWLWQSICSIFMTSVKNGALCWLYMAHEKFKRRLSALLITSEMQRLWILCSFFFLGGGENLSRFLNNGCFINVTISFSLVSLIKSSCFPVKILFTFTSLPPEVLMILVFWLFYNSLQLQILHRPAASLCICGWNRMLIIETLNTMTLKPQDNLNTDNIYQATITKCVGSCI